MARNESANFTARFFRPVDVASALTGFEPIWESLTVREQSRIVQLIIKQVDYDGSTGRVTITFHPDGIKSIAINGHNELEAAAS